MAKGFLALAIFLLSSEASAKLLVQDFKNVIDSSDLIVLAIPSHVSREKTEFQVMQSYKGEAPEIVAVNHTRELHDQRIRYLGDHLLFLSKSESGEWVAASYGRSYWPLLYSLDADEDKSLRCAYSIPKVYPISMVSMDGYVKTTTRKINFDYIPHDKNGIEMEVYCKQDVEQFIENHLTSASRDGAVQSAAP